jgi:hypothetical protein
MIQRSPNGNIQNEQSRPDQFTPADDPEHVAEQEKVPRGY